MGMQSERIIQSKLGSRERAERFYQSHVQDHLTPQMQDFIRRQSMVFIATADAEGSCDCSPRFGKEGLVLVIDELTLAYPEFRGNGVFASLGNISENPQIGLLFIDFLETTVGLHVNGRAACRPASEIPAQWKTNYTAKMKSAIEQWVVIEVEEAFIHCSKHVPKFQTLDKKIWWGTDDPVKKSSAFFEHDG
jgi:predicted pyridoxine 5'-phosphate oxidase superfamily flavin-nucleotide-binding protein